MFVNEGHELPWRGEEGPPTRVARIHLCLGLPHALPQSIPTRHGLRVRNAAPYAECQPCHASASCWECAAVLYAPAYEILLAVVRVLMRLRF